MDGGAAFRHNRTMTFYRAERMNVVPRLAVITRAVEDAADFVSPLTTSGWHVVGIPLITCNAVPFKPFQSFSQPVDWLVFTSRWGVTHYLAQDGMIPEGSRIAVVGSQTADCLMQQGFHPTLVAESGTAHSLAQALLKATPVAGKVLWPCGNRALTDWTQQLENNGWVIEPLEVYRTQLNTHLTSTEHSACQEASVIAFTSPSCVEALFQGLKHLGTQPSLQWPLLAIGPSTENALQQWFGRCSGMATPHTLAGLAQLTQQGAQQGARP